jgi:hypothetical protein
VVTRIFAGYLAGAGIYALAEKLTAEGIPSPSAHDPGRNRHRSGIAWSKGAIRAILPNPRYTGGMCVVSAVRGPRSESHLTYMIDIALTAEFPLTAGSAR